MEADAAEARVAAGALENMGEGWGEKAQRRRALEEVAEKA